MGDKSKRCFGTGTALYEKYHDEEWGVPTYDDLQLFEMLSLECAQAGLSWETILKKREGYRRLFHQFVPNVVAKMTDQELEKILKNPAIVRHCKKIFSVRVNAQVVLRIQKECGSFAAYLWGFVDHQPVLHHFETVEEVPCHLPISDALANDLKKRGMLFMGTKIAYAFMQAAGLVNDHVAHCWRFIER